MRRAALLCLLTQGAAASDALARVDGVLAWLAGNATAPAHWPIRSRDDVKSKNWKHLGGGNVKDVYETKVDGKRVVVKTRLTSAAHQDRVEADARGELLYLEFLRDLPGVPRLHGGWLQDHKLWYVVQHAGENFGLGKGTRHRPTRVNRGWAALVKKDPMGAARALLDCCRSFADRGYFLTDFIASQFAVKGSTVSLIDAPPALSGPMVARGVPRVALIPPNKKGTCATDGDCPHSFSWHCCCQARNAGEECEKNTVGGGAPEARGRCLAGTCARLTAKTHVFDVASKAWALPYVHRAARGDDKRRLEALMARMRAPEPSDRPNFTEALDALARRRLKKEEWHGDCSGRLALTNASVANGSLVIVPHVNRRGFIDVVFRYEFAGEIAARVGAQVALPRPCDALAKVHNGNHLVNCSHGWDRYRNWSRVVGAAPMVANSSEAGGRAPVTGASFDAQFRSARDMAARGERFVWNLPSNVRDQKRHIVGLDEWQACGPRYKTRKDFVGSAMDAGPSAAVVDLADRFRATLAGNFSTLHLRRSDALTHKAQKRKRCGTKVATVKTYVDCVYPPPRCGPTRCKSKADAERRDTLVVFTDERDQRYLDELYDALKSTGRDVVFGDAALRELAGDGGRDNYFVFAASLVVREASFPRLAMDRSHCETHSTCAQFSSGG